MACFTVRTVSVELTVADQEVLVRGLRAAGFMVHVSNTGTITTRKIGGGTVQLSGGQLSGQPADVRRYAPMITKAYAAEAVRTAAQKFGYVVTQDRQDAGHLNLGRRF